MSTRPMLTVLPTPEFTDYFAGMVRSGLFGRASEVVRTGLRLPDAQRGNTLADVIAGVPCRMGVRTICEMASRG